MKRFKNSRLLALLLSLSVGLNAAVQSTLAYITTQTMPAQNVFVPYQSVEGDLVISKTVEHPFGGSYVVPEHIQFDFEIDLGTLYAGYTFSTTYGDVSANENGVLIVPVKPDAPVGIEGIDEGTEVTVREIQKDNDGFSIKDSAVRTAVISSEEQSVLDFTNIYEPAPVKPDNINVSGLKKLSGRQWQSGDDFTFLLEALDENGEWSELGTKTVIYDEDNENFNSFDFSNLIHDLEFSTIGDYSFRISEISGNVENIIYDDVKNNFVITVTDDDMDGNLEIQDVTASQNAEVSENEGKYNVNVVFNNTYMPVTETTTTTTTTTEPTTSTTTSTTTTKPTTSTTTSTTTTKPTTSTTTSTTTTKPTTSTTTSTTTTKPTTSTTTSTTTTKSTTSTTTSTTTTKPTTSTTTSTTTTEPTTSTTTSTTTTTPVTTLASYVVIENPVVGYYFNHDNRPFEKGQLGRVYMIYVDENGTETDKIEITDDVDFNGETPQDTYYEDNKTFRYHVKVYLEGEVLKDKNGEDITVIAYIGVKGDTDLSNVADASDASIVLRYYAEIQTGGVPEETILYSANDVYLENLSAFLSDVDTNEYDEENWKTDKSSDSLKSQKRVLDASDSSTILRFYAIQQTERTRTPHDIWLEIRGKDYVIS